MTVEAAMWFLFLVSITLNRRLGSAFASWRKGFSSVGTPKKDPEKNYRNLQKAMAKLFQNYPLGFTKK
jgi:hypothetical protein